MPRSRDDPSSRPRLTRMPQLESAAGIPLDAESVFAVATALGDLRASWDPYVERRMLVRGAAAQRAGSVVFERSPAGRRLLLTVETWFPPQLVGARMVKGPWWLGDYGESLRLRPVGPSAVEATRKVAFHVRGLAPDVVGTAVAPRFAAENAARLTALVAACADARIVEQATSGSLPPGSVHLRRARRAAQAARPPR